MDNVGGVPMVHTNGMGDAGGWMGMLLVIALLGGGLWGGKGHDGGWGEGSALAYHDRSMHQNFLQRDMFDLQRDVLLQGERTLGAIAQTGFQNALGQRDIIHSADRNHFETNRNLDGIRFQGEANTNRLIQSNCEQTQRLLDHMNAERFRQLENELRRSEMREQTATIIAAQLPPRAVPAYPAPNPFVPFAVENRFGFGGGCPAA